MKNVLLRAFVLTLVLAGFGSTVKARVTPQHSNVLPPHCTPWDGCGEN